MTAFADFRVRSAWVIPYDPKAWWDGTTHTSASLKALQELGDRKGYALVGCCLSGVNAFFVRRDVLSGLPELPVADAYVESRFRESRDPDGMLTYVSDHRDRQELMANMPVVDVVTGAQTSVGSVLLSPG